MKHIFLKPFYASIATLELSRPDSL